MSAEEEVDVSVLAGEEPAEEEPAAEEGAADEDKGAAANDGPMFVEKMRAKQVAPRRLCVRCVLNGRAQDEGDRGGG